MPSTIPNTREEILATGENIDPDFTKAFESSPAAQFKPSNVAELKGIMETSFYIAQAKLASTKLGEITEKEILIPLHNGYKSRTIVVHKTTLTKPAPLIVLFHGGAHCVGFPEMEVSLARELAIKENAVVLCPSYRLGPEYPFPFSIEDSWSVIQFLASETQTPYDPTHPLLPAETSAEAGFIIGGSSAGASLGASIAHLARDSNLSPPLTGQFLAAGMYMSPSHVPEKYKPYYLSREQNAHRPLYNTPTFELFQAAYKPDHTDKRYASFDQHDPKDQPGEVAHGHMRLPPAYFQACGSDISRDDSLIYAKVLRDECKVPTSLDLYESLPHCWWGMFPKMQSSVKRMDDSVQGVKWLLGLSKAS